MHRYQAVVLTQVTGVQRAAEDRRCLDTLQLIAQASGPWSIVHFAYAYFLISLLYRVWCTCECNIHKIICFGGKKQKREVELYSLEYFDWDVLPCAPAGGIMLME